MTNYLDFRYGLLYIIITLMLGDKLLKSNPNSQDIIIKFDDIKK